LRVVYGGRERMIREEKRTISYHPVISTITSYHCYPASKLGFVYRAAT
jgi:hypothetical protein